MMGYAKRVLRWSTIGALGLLYSCAALPADLESHSDHHEAEMNLPQDELWEHFDQEGAFLVSPVLRGEEGVTRVGVLLLLSPGAAAPRLEARAVDPLSGEGPWVPVVETWSETVHAVGIAELGGLSEGAQLRVSVHDIESIDWLTFNAALPADPELAYAADDDIVEGLAYRRLPPMSGLVTRDMWRARPTRCSSRNSEKYRMAIHYTVTPSGGDLAARVRGIQRYHMDSNGWCDIGYHFLVGTDGTVFEGRPLHLLGAHVGRNNTGNIGIAFIGCFHPGSCERWPPITPPDTMIRAGGELVGELSRMYGISISSSTVKGHRNHAGQSTSCPGDHLASKLDRIRTYARTHLSTADAPVPSPPPSTETPAPAPRPAPPPPSEVACGALGCGDCGAAPGCSFCGSRGACVSASEMSSCTYSGAIPSRSCALESYWPCASTQCWDPEANLRTCGRWSISEDFRSGAFSLHRYWLTVGPEGPVELELERRAGWGFTPAMVVSDRTGRVVFAGDTVSLHPEIEVIESASGRDGRPARVTLRAARRINLFVYVSGWEVIDAGYGPRVTTSARYDLTASQGC